jgi:hypothetical protein
VSPDGVRYVVMAEYHVGHSRIGWQPVVVGSVPRRPWRERHVYLTIKGPSMLTGCDAHELRDPHIEEVASNDPLLLGPFNQSGPDGVQHYPTEAAARRNLERLLWLAAKKTRLRSSVVERPLRKRQVESSNLSGGSKWVRRLEYQMAQNERNWQNMLDEHPTWSWVAGNLAKKRGSPITPPAASTGDKLDV